LEAARFLLLFERQRSHGDALQETETVDSVVIQSTLVFFRAAMAGQDRAGFNHKPKLETN
jgi:hypothetical protein